MFSPWFWWLWLVIMFALLMPSISYGWAYRGWGPPYSSYLQRRRAQRAAAAGGSAPVGQDASGWRADLLWGGFLVVTFWAIAAAYWRG